MTKSLSQMIWNLWTYSRKKKLILKDTVVVLRVFSCMSSSRPSISSSDENESAQNTSSTVQYSTVAHSGYRHQVPSVQVFSRSESTQPLLDSEERPEDLQLVDNVDGSDGILPRQRYFKQNCSQHETSPDISWFWKVTASFLSQWRRFC